MKPKEATESCDNAANVATGQKELDSQCVSRVALTTEYDSSIPGTQKINPVAGETEKESQHVERRVWVYHHCQSGPLTMNIFQNQNYYLKAVFWQKNFNCDEDVCC